MALTYTRLSQIRITNSSSATIEFTNISASYSDLVLSIAGKSTSSDDNNGMVGIALNAGTRASWRGVVIDGTPIAGGAEMVSIGPNTPFMRPMIGATTLYFSSYSNTNHFKLSSAITGNKAHNDAANWTGVGYNIWNTTTTISSITLSSLDSGAFSAGTVATLYGILRA